MLKLCRVINVKVFFLVLVYVFNFDLFEFSAAILEKILFLLSLTRKFHRDKSTNPNVITNDFYTKLTVKSSYCKAKRLNK